MGTWGPGNFDNDSANDYVDEFTRELADKIEQFFAGDEDECDFEEEGEGVIIHTIEILAVICEECSGLPPAPEVVAGWKTNYLRIYDYTTRTSTTFRRRLNRSQGDAKS